MTDPKTADHAAPAHALVDPERERGATPFDADDEFTGQVYDRGREAAEGAALPAGQEDRVAAGGDPRTPPAGDNRASFDPATGAVHGPELVEDGGLPSPPRDGSGASSRE